MNEEQETMVRASASTIDNTEPAMPSVLALQVYMVDHIIGIVMDHEVNP